MAGYIGSKTVNLSTTGADIAGDADVSGALDVGGAFTSKGIDDNATSTAMTLDGSGNLLVGKTAADGATDGGEIRAGGTLVNTTNNSTTAYFNRRTSDGDLISFQKDGSTVGSIGVATAGVSDENLYIANGDTGLRFRYNDDSIIPSNNTGSFRDNAIDLGLSNARFKDLYLSGGVYLGGTGAANKLDDYEEGTWTPELRVSDSTVGITYNNRHGFYTKTGRLVHICGTVTLTDKGSNTGAVFLHGLPFAIANLTGDTALESGSQSVDWYTGNNSNVYHLALICHNSQGGLSFYKKSSTTGSLSAALVGADIADSFGFRIGMTYVTD